VEGVTSGAITASRVRAEATEASDNAPTLAQPDIIVEQAQAFVPFSIELGQDWGALQSEMAMLLQDAKDDLEATKFALGAGHGSHEPKGIITARPTRSTAGGTAAFAIADLYKLFEALPPRFRPRAQWVGTSSRTTRSASSTPPAARACGRSRTASAAASAARSATRRQRRAEAPRPRGLRVDRDGVGAHDRLEDPRVGDFRYFVIVDRVGMDIELLPHLLGANRRPTGQRGLYAYWRNSSDVLSASAFQVLVTG
jgi:predicted phage gp36 major capsid-like protein